MVRDQMLPLMLVNQANLMEGITIIKTTIIPIIQIIPIILTAIMM